MKLNIKRLRHSPDSPNTAIIEGYNQSQRDFYDARRDLLDRIEDRIAETERLGQLPL